MLSITNRKASEIFGGGAKRLNHGLKGPQNNKKRVSI